MSSQPAQAAIALPAPRTAPRPLALSLALPLLLAAVALVLPFTVKGFVISQITQVLIYAIAIMGLNLLTGFNGQFSLGHSAFYALGAYTAAIMMEIGGVHYLWTFPAAAAVCFAAGFLFGLPALRLEGVYLALATFALAVTTPQLLKLSFVEHWTRGVQGLELNKPEAPGWLPLNQDQFVYALTLAVGLLLYAAAVNLVRSRTGRAMMAIRDNPIAARSMGVNTALYKSLAFGVSACFTGVAGVLSALLTAYVAPDSFTFALSVQFLVGMVVGGVAWLPGALVGGLFVLYVPNVAEHISKSLSGFFFGVILILLIYLMPTGAFGLYRRLAGVLARRPAPGA